MSCCLNEDIFRSKSQVTNSQEENLEKVREYILNVKRKTLLLK